MHPLQVTMIMSTTTMLLISALFLLIKTIPSRPGIKWWLAASFIKAIIYLFAILNFDKDNNTIGTIIFYSLTLSVTICLNIGTLLFADVPIIIKKRLLIFLISTTVTVALILLDSPFVASLCFAMYCAYYLFETAYKIYGTNDNQLSFKFTAVLMTLNAIHWLDYPFLSKIEWFAPIGFMLGMILLASTFLSLAVLALLQFKKQTQDSERRAVEAAKRDALTGLYNRSHLDKLFGNYAKEANQIERSFMLMYIDLDGFKTINDTYGHKAGDIILKRVAKRLRIWLGRKGDAIRIGGDELVVLTRLRDKYDRKNTVVAAQLLLDAIEKPIIDGKNTYHISASIGNCCYGIPHRSLDKMLNEADKLMYAAKKAGGKRIYFSKTTNSPTEKINLIKNHEVNDVILVKGSHCSSHHL